MSSAARSSSKHVLVHRRGGGVLHAAEDEVAHHDLGVALPGKRHAGEPREQLDHARRLAEAARGVRLARWRHVVAHGHLSRIRQFCGAIVDDREVAGDERHQVARMRLVQTKVIRPRFLAGAARRLRVLIATMRYNINGTAIARDTQRPGGAFAPRGRCVSRAMAVPLMASNMVAVKIVVTAAPNFVWDLAFMFPPEEKSGLGEQERAQPAWVDATLSINP